MTLYYNSEWTLFQHSKNLMYVSVVLDEDHLPLLYLVCVIGYTLRWIFACLFFFRQILVTLRECLFCWWSSLITRTTLGSWERGSCCVFSRASGETPTCLLLLLSLAYTWRSLPVVCCVYYTPFFTWFTLNVHVVDLHWKVINEPASNVQLILMSFWNHRRVTLDKLVQGF